MTLLGLVLIHIQDLLAKRIGERIPSVSYNLRHGGSLLIDRKDQNKRSLIKNFRNILKNTN
jgi:1-acyl-sn-glycerol-3-phosphate acyltransferase